MSVTVKSGGGENVKPEVSAQKDIITQLREAVAGKGLGGNYDLGYADGYEEGQKNSEFFERYMARSFTEFESDTAYPVPTYMFAENAELESVSMPNIEVVNGKAFMDCPKLASVHLPKVKKLLGDDCFRRDTSLTSFPYFEQLEEITGYCFDECPIEQKVWDFKNLTKVSAQYAFYNAAAEVIILRKAINGGMDRIFHTMPNVETIDLHDAFTIGRYAFQDCPNLEAVILRDTVNVFALKNVDVLTSNINYYAYVPASMLETYKAYTNWSSYPERIRAIEDYPEITGGVY